MREETTPLGIAGLYKPFNKEKHTHKIEGNDSVREIFGKRYLCIHNDMLTRNTDDLKTFGVRLSGHSDIDRQQQNADVTTWLNISTMAHYLRLGVNVRVVKYADTKSIYESVTKHIGAWRQNYGFTVNRIEVPLEDLQALEDLSIKVFPAARAIMLREGLVKDYFDKAVTKFDLVTESSLFTRNSYNEKHNIVTTHQDLPAKIEIVREDNSDYILDRISKLGGGLNGL